MTFSIVDKNASSYASYRIKTFGASRDGFRFSKFPKVILKAKELMRLESRNSWR